MKNIVLICITFFMSISFQAQKSKTLLDEVSNKVKSYENIYIDFKYTLNNTKEKVNQETRGNVTLQGDNYLLNMLGTTRLFNGKTIYTIVPEDEEVTISAYNAQDDKEITPSKMLTFYEKGYTYKMDVLQNIKGRRIQFIKLIPIDTHAEIKNILLGVDIQTKHIYKLIQTDSQGTQFTITVNSFKTNQLLSKTLFTFNETKYEEDGYYINKID